VTVKSILVGALAGLVVTVAITFLWPRRLNRHLGAVTGAVIGFGVAYLVMTQVTL
jgi:cobalamin synthase